MDQDIRHKTSGDYEKEVAIYAALKEFLTSLDFGGREKPFDVQGDFSFMLIATVKPKDPTNFVAPDATRFDRAVAMSTVVLQINPALKPDAEGNISANDLYRLGPHVMAMPMIAKALTSHVIPSAIAHAQQAAVNRMEALDD